MYTKRESEREVPGYKTNKRNNLEIKCHNCVFIYAFAIFA